MEAASRGKLKGLKEIADPLDSEKWLPVAQFLNGLQPFPP